MQIIRLIWLSVIKINLNVPRNEGLHIIRKFFWTLHWHVDAGLSPQQDPSSSLPNTSSSDVLDVFLDRI